MDIHFMDEHLQNSDYIGKSELDIKKNASFDYVSVYDDYNKIYRIHDYIFHPNFKLPTGSKKTKKTETRLSKFLIQCANHLNIFLVLPNIAQFKIPLSEYMSSRPQHVFWTSIKDLSQTEFYSLTSKMAIKLYKHIDDSINVITSLRMIENLPLYIEKTIIEDPYSTPILHFIGVSKDAIGEVYLSAYNNYTRTIQKHNIATVFKSLGPQSLAIFDGDNSGRALEVFKTMIDSNSDTITRTDIFIPGGVHTKASFKDAFCLCSCRSNEAMILSPVFPKDFFTAVLLTPVQTFILWYIVLNFKSYFNSTDFPIDSFDSLLAYGTELSDILEKEISVVAQGIAAECMEISMFSLLFRRQKYLSLYFTRFILAQYMLDAFDIHPVSYPELPDMSQSSKWNLLTDIVHSWVLSKVAPVQFIKVDLFQLAIQSFIRSTHAYLDKFNAAMASSIVDLLPTTRDMFVPMAYYASVSEKHRKTLLPLLSFEAILITILDSNTNIFNRHAACYLAFCCLQKSKVAEFVLSSQFDFSPILNLAFDHTLKETTRALLFALLTKVIQYYQPALEMCQKDSFLANVVVNLEDESPVSLSWMLLLFKNVWNTSPFEISKVLELNLHIGIARLLSRAAYQLRACVVSTLMCFMQPNDPRLNTLILLLASPAALDGSSYVRQQFLSLLIKYLRFGSKKTESFKASKLSLKSFFQQIFGMDCQFDRMYRTGDKRAKAAYDAVYKVFTPGRGISIARYLLEFLCHDPTPLISVTAQIHRDYIKSKEKNLALFNFMKVFKTPPKDPSYDDGDYMIKSMSDITIQAGLWNPERPSVFCEYPKIPNRLSPDCFSHVPSQISLKYCKTIGEHSLKLFDFVPYSNEIVANTTGNNIVWIDRKLEVKMRISLPDKSSISDIAMLHASGQTNVVIANTEGCLYVWDMTEDIDNITSFRVGLDTTSSARVLLAPMQTAPRVATFRLGTGIALWDVEALKPIGEWSLKTNSMVTKMRMHHTEDTLCVAGLASGGLIAVDFRCPQSEFAQTVKCENGTAVVGLTRIYANEYQTYAASANGVVKIWDRRMDTASNLIKGVGRVISITSVPSFAGFIITSESGMPVYYSPSGQMLCTLRGVEPGAMAIGHPYDDVCAFGSRIGNISTHVFEISSSEM